MSNVKRTIFDFFKIDLRNIPDNSYIHTKDEIIYGVNRSIFCKTLDYKECGIFDMVEVWVYKGGSKTVIFKSLQIENLNVEKMRSLIDELSLIYGDDCHERGKFHWTDIRDYPNKGNVWDGRHWLDVGQNYIIDVTRDEKMASISIAGIRNEYGYVETKENCSNTENKPSENLKSVFDSGYAKSQSGDFHTAISDYNRVIEINSSFPLVYWYRGNLKGRLGDYYGAITDFNEAIRIGPSYDKVYFDRGFAKAKLEDYQNAIPDYSMAIELNPQNALAYNNRGLARGKLGDYQGSISDLSEALKIDPNAKDAYYNRGAAKAFLRNYQGAISDLTKAIEINPNNDKAYYNRGLSKGHLNDYEGAISDFNEAIKINPNFSEAKYILQIAKSKL